MGDNMNNMWFSYQEVLSYNALINIIIGSRGVGKTYGFKEYAIKHYKKSKKQFVYLRRYESDLKESVGNTEDVKFFEQVKKLFPNDSFNVKKSKKIIKLLMNNEVIGYALPLSASDSIKSVSFENVDLICYDEFQLKEGSNQHYLANEVEVLLDIIETIGRLRNDLKIFCLGNAITISSPIFNYFDLSLPYNSNIKTFKNGTILVCYAKNKDYEEAKKKTRFGELINNTRYGKYAIDNEFLTDSKAFIGKKSKNVRLYFILLIDGKEYGIWKDTTEEKLYISEDIDKNCPIKFALNDMEHNENYILTKSKTNPYIRNIYNYYKFGKLYFENQKIKNVFRDNVLRYMS